MGWLSIDVIIIKKGNCYITTNLNNNMKSNDYELIFDFMLRVKKHLIKQYKYREENIVFSV